jgi:hypothetical protein
MSDKDKKKKVEKKVYRTGLVVTAATKRTAKHHEEAIKAYPDHTMAGLPVSVDWRTGGYVTPIQDQGDCGSCVAFGTTAAVEASRRIALSDPKADIKLSEADLFNGIGTCSTGSSLEKANSKFQQTGVCPEKCWPYNGSKQSCCDGNKFKTLGATKLTSDAAAKQWLATKGPIQAAMAVNSDFFDVDNNDVYHETYGDFAGNHCICLVGYDDTNQCWILKNSWGTSWGASGYCRIGYGESGILRDFVAYGEQVAASPPVSQTGVIITTNDTQKANVVDATGKVVGQTDGFIALVAGSYTFTLKKAGWVDLPVSFEVVDGKVTTLSVTMVPIPSPGDIVLPTDGTLTCEMMRGWISASLMIGDKEIPFSTFKLMKYVSLGKFAAGGYKLQLKPKDGKLYHNLLVANSGNFWTVYMGMQPKLWSNVFTFRLSPTKTTHIAD